VMWGVFGGSTATMWGRGSFRKWNKHPAFHSLLVSQFPKVIDIVTLGQN
jgi:hypothetical protein